MNRDQYITQVAKNISDYPQDEIKQILSDLDNYFKEEINNGKSEEDICKQLGDVNTYINNVLNKDTTIASKTNILKFTTQSCSLLFNNSDSFNINYDSNYTVNTTTINNVTDYSIKYNKVSVTNTYLPVTISLDESITDIIIETLSGPIDISNIELKTLKIKTLNGTLNINKSTIYQLDINQTSGDININNSNIYNCNSKANNGNFNSTDNEYNTLDINTKNGDVQVQDKINDTLNINTINGDITLSSNDISITLDTKGDVNTAINYSDNNLIVIGNGQASGEITSLNGNITIK